MNNLAIILKRKRDEEARLARTSPQAVFNDDGTTQSIGVLPHTHSEYAVLSGASAPTTSTVGALGQFYLETTTPALYQCTAVGAAYTWTEVGGGGSYTLPQATGTTLGGIVAATKTTESAEVKIDAATGKLYVPAAGAAANGVAAGGTAGQIYAKIDSTDYNAHWINAPGGGGAYSPDTPPSSPSAWDDEFSDGTIDTAWEDYNLASGTKAEAPDVQVLKIGAAGSGLSQQGLVRSCPTGNFTITTKLIVHATLSASWRYGLVVAASKTGAAYVGTLLAQNSSSFYWLYEIMNSPTSRAGYNLGSGPGLPYGYLRMRVYNDSGIWRVTSSYSTNGYKYNVFDTARALGFTPAYAGLVVNSEGISGVNEGWFDWFRVTED